MLSTGYAEVAPTMVSPFTHGWGMVGEFTAGSLPTSTTYEALNRAVWYALPCPIVCVAKRMWWANGSAVAGNVEAGIYRDAGYKPGAMLVTTGSVAQATASVIQFADITDTTLTPQLYWLYLSCSSTTAQFLRSSFTGALEDLYKMEQTGGVGPGSAPATATPVEATSANCYLFGFSTTTIT